MDVVDEAAVDMTPEASFSTDTTFSRGKRSKTPLNIIPVMAYPTGMNPNEKCDTDAKLNIPMRMRDSARSRPRRGGFERGLRFECLEVEFYT